MTRDDDTARTHSYGRAMTSDRPGEPGHRPKEARKLSLVKTIRLAVVSAAVAAFFAPGGFAATPTILCIGNPYWHVPCSTHHVRPAAIERARTVSTEKGGLREASAKCFSPYTHLPVRCILSVPSQPN